MSPSVMTGDLPSGWTFFSSGGTLKANAAKKQMEFGFMWACEYGHTKVVDFLLKMGVDVEGQPHGETGLHWAAYAGHSRSVRVLLKWDAPVEVKDKRFNGTPLGWALYGWCQPPPEGNPAGYYDVVARLVARGAKVDQDWLAEARRGMPIAKRVRADKRMLHALNGQMPG